MSPSARAIYGLLEEVRVTLLKAECEVQLDTEHLRDELWRLLEQVDILRGKVEVEERLLCDKEALKNRL